MTTPHLPIGDVVVRRLAQDSEWAESQLGRTLALLVDRPAVSIPSLCDYLSSDEETVYPKSMYRWIRNMTNGQPKMHKRARIRFHNNLKAFRSAYDKATEAGEFDAPTDAQLADENYVRLDAEGMVQILRAYTD